MMKKAILTGTKAYYDDQMMLLSKEMDMTDCLCQRKGMSLIQHSTIADHMDALLVAMEKLGNSKSPRLLY